MKKSLFHLCWGLSCFSLFAAWTAAVQHLDVQQIGPNHSAVGFARLNVAFHRLTGVHMDLYIVTDWLSLIPVFIMTGFALTGLIQWLKRRSILKVDADILLLGAFYLAVFAAYLFFEKFPLNFRPVLIDGCLEASYPSSTTLLVLTVMTSAILQIRRRMRRGSLRKTLTAFIMVFTISMVSARLLAGVHWLTDIVGGILLSAALTEAYSFFLIVLTKHTKPKY